MRRLRQHMIHSRQRQRGVVAVIVGITIVLLVGMLGLVLDLGHLYIAKTELQNAADAAALSGAKQLNGTLAGVCCGTDSAQARAIEAAGRNNYDLNATAVTLTAANLSVGNCPDDSCMVAISSVTTSALAANKTFLKVDTGSRNFNTWFIQVLGGISTTQTFGMAVAGRFLVNITPLGVCAISPTKTATDPTTNELIEFGFRRGIAYNIPDLNPFGSSALPMWLNPVDSPPVTCNPAHASDSFTRPFVCKGNAATISALPQNVYVSTGTTSAQERPLNSRFDNFSGGFCDSVSAPPDTNIKPFTANAGNPNPASCPSSNTNTVGCGFPRDWMDTTNSTSPAQQTISLAPGASGRRVPVPAPTYLQYGALWSFSRAVNAASTPFNASNTNWSTLYNSGVPLSTLINIPPNPPTDTGGFPLGGYPDPADTSMSPYKKGNLAGSGNKYFAAPSVSHPGTANRRVLTVAILDCDSLVGGGGGGAISCGRITAVGLGKFFMQVPANLPSKIEAEFAGLVPQLPPADIRLYR